MCVVCVVLLSLLQALLPLVCVQRGPYSKGGLCLP